MYNVKEKIEEIRPLRDLVKVEILIPKEVKTPSGLIMLSSDQMRKFYDGVQLYEAKILEFSAEAAAKCTGLLEVGDIVIVDRLAGVSIPTEGDKFIKLVSYSSMIVKKGQDFGIQTKEELQPLFERVLVEDDSLKDTTESGIYLGKARTSGNEDVETIGGKVLGVAPDVKEPVAKGDRVRYEGVMGVTLAVAGAVLRVIVYHDLIARIGS